MSVECVDGSIAVSERPPPTPTVVPEPACVGDCDESGRINIDELVLATNIVQRIAPLSQCIQIDQNNDGLARVNELVTAINLALRGCPE